jgi:hypothetical protein
MNELVNRYIDVWNEKDPAARRAQVEALFAADGRIQDVHGFLDKVPAQ